MKFHLEATNRRVDVIGEGFDIALRVRFPPVEDSELVMRKLGESTQRLVAAPRPIEHSSPIPVPATSRCCPVSTSAHRTASTPGICKARAARSQPSCTSRAS